MGTTSTHEKHSRQALILKACLLVVWASVSFVCCFFARDLQFMVAGWPFNYWMAAQGAVLVFIAILAFYAWAMNRMADSDTGTSAFDA
jgi:putative solute:sodium symporter small subunit